MKKRIMLHIYTIYVLRKLKDPLIAESVLFLTFAATLLFSVSVPSVMTNMAASGNFHRYLIMAFSTTDFLVQTILVLVGITALLLLRNITVQTVSWVRSPVLAPSQ